MYLSRNFYLIYAQQPVNMSVIPDTMSVTKCLQLKITTLETSEQNYLVL